MFIVILERKVLENMWIKYIWRYRFLDVSLYIFIIFTIKHYYNKNILYYLYIKLNLFLFNFYCITSAKRNMIHINTHMIRFIKIFY